jgi:MFS family permease
LDVVAKYCAARLLADHTAEESQHITTKAVLSAFKEPHIINISVASFCNGVVIGGLSYFPLSIVQALGYSSIQIQLLSVPPLACAFVVTMITAMFADRYHRRGLSALCCLSMGIVGSALNLTCTSVAARHTSICLLVTSIYSSGPCVLSWIPNNSSGYAKRSTSIAIGVCYQ